MEINLITSEICDLFDVEVITDIDEMPDGGTRRVYALGWYPERSAGLYGNRITPWFESTESLEAFCARNSARFAEYKDADQAPDATEWE